MSGRMYILGMDIGGTNFRMGLVTPDFKVTRMEIVPSKTIYSEDKTAENFANVIEKYMERNVEKEDQIQAISIGCPSVVDRERRTLISSTNFPGLDGIDLVSVLEERLDRKVFIEHDAYYLLAYDIFRNGMKNQGTIIGCYFGTGLGNAMYINGEAYIGKNGTACELGHLPVPLSSRPCSCGNTGCIEMYSCGKALEKIAKERYPSSYIGDLFSKHGDDKILKEFVEYMAVAVAAEANILDPDCIFIGGGIVQMEGFPKKELIERIIRHCRRPYPAQNLNLRYSLEGKENGIVGAAIRAMYKMNKES